MKILVTGGAGFIGTNLVKKLLDRGDEVFVVDNLNSYYAPKIKMDNLSLFEDNARFHFFNVNIINKSKLKQIFTNKPEVVVHLAARAGVRPSIKYPVPYVINNVAGTVNVLELSKEFKIPKLIFASSSSIYANSKRIPFVETINIGNPVSPYAVTKRTGEILCQMYHNLYGLNIFSLRFFTVYGPYNRPDMGAYKFVDSIYKGLPITIYGDGSTMRDYTYVEDAVDGILKSIELCQGYEIINIGSSRPIQLNDFIKHLEKHLGKKAKKIKKPIPLGDAVLTYANISKAKKLLNWKPKTTIDEGVKKLVEWYLRVNEGRV